MASPLVVYLSVAGSFLVWNALFPRSANLLVPLEAIAIATAACLGGFIATPIAAVIGALAFPASWWTLPPQAYLVALGGTAFGVAAGTVVAGGLVFLVGSWFEYGFGFHLDNSSACGTLCGPPFAVEEGFEDLDI